ncbi:type III-B CRISPR module RAMP protein Cmr4, partial [bacterium]|nr:type III-B CRISPR module RAMP protein Cmr4 [bacterium]
WPYAPGSAVKGVLVAAHGASEAGQREGASKAAFGKSADDQANENAGSLVLTDARLVCLPVRSLTGTFAWVSCPMALRRLQADAAMAAQTTLQNLTIPAPELEEALLSQSGVLNAAESVYLEDLKLEPTVDAVVSAWAEHLANVLGLGDEFKQRFVIIHDDLFQFLCTTALEIRARIRLQAESKTTAGGALWYEEALPPESILSGVVWCDQVFGANLTPKQLLDSYCGANGDAPSHFQMGGDASTGKGVVRAIGLARPSAKQEHVS